MALEMEDLAMIRKAESIQDELWSLVAQWNNFAKDTIGKQLVRAADSIGANMAESYGRFNYGEKIQFLYYARGSLFETKYWLNRALSRNLIGLADHEAYASALSDIARQINSFVGHLKTKRGQSSKPSAREEQAPYRLDQFEEATDLVFSEDDLGFLGHF
ncbi:MAG: four helix bundle protein [Anaerolineae bacterium]|nr:four helix bundle protein [Anaerolineae bacterium]